MIFSNDNVNTLFQNTCTTSLNDFCIRFKKNETQITLIEHDTYYIEQLPVCNSAMLFMSKSLKHHKNQMWKYHKARTSMTRLVRQVVWFVNLQTCFSMVCIHFIWLMAKHFSSLKYSSTNRRLFVEKHWSMLSLSHRLWLLVLVTMLYTVCVCVCRKTPNEDVRASKKIVI